VDKKNLISLLEAGNSCMLVPGGNRETHFMEHGCEVHDINGDVYLAQVLDFV